MDHQPHFVKPMLPGFYSGLTIPLSFFAKHIEGYSYQRTWKLRSDASEKTWEVLREGRRLSRGWKEFATAHDLRIGDIVIFRHEGEMEFHVTPFGQSCVEIKYKSNETDDAAGGPEARTSFEYCFLAEVNASNLTEDKLYLPLEAASSAALNKQCQEAILVNKERNPWIVRLRFSESEGMYYITRGWRKLCRENRCTIGDLFVFNVVGDGNSSPLFCVCPERKETTTLMINHLSRKSGDFCLGSTSGTK